MNPSSRPLKRFEAMLALLVLTACVGCIRPAPGPAFEWAATPSANRGRIYLYRTDSRGSAAVVKTTIDRRDTGTFHNREYNTFEIAAGSHRLRTAMRGFGFFALGWNEHVFRIRPGEVLFLHLEVRIVSTAEPQLGSPRELEIGGQSDQRVSENIFIGERTREEAEEDLAATTRIVEPD